MCKGSHGAGSMAQAHTLTVESASGFDAYSKMFVIVLSTSLPANKLPTWTDGIRTPERTGVTHFKQQWF
jgi:hypothetical protein